MEEKDFKEALDMLRICVSNLHKELQERDREMLELQNKMALLQTKINQIVPMLNEIYIDTTTE